MPDTGSFVLLALAGGLLVFMMYNSRKRMKKMKDDQLAKQTQTVPGAEVLLQSGIYGTIVSYDHENLDEPAEVEIAPGVVIRAHSQAILRVVEPEGEEELAQYDAPDIESINGNDAHDGVESVEETRRRLDNNG